MNEDFAQAFASLKPILGKYAQRISVKADTPAEYTLVTKSRRRSLNIKGEPLHFGSVRVGKAYVSFHLMPLYKQGTHGQFSPGLKKAHAREDLLQLQDHAPAGTGWGIGRIDRNKISSVGRQEMALGAFPKTAIRNF